jgi:hypothetical protein
VSALDELEQGDKIRVVEEIVISPPPVNGVAVDLIGIDAAGAQERRDAVGARVGPEKSTRARRDELPAAGNAAGANEARACAAAGAPGGAGTPGGCMPSSWAATGAPGASSSNRSLRGRRGKKFSQKYTSDVRSTRPVSGT